MIKSASKSKNIHILFIILFGFSLLSVSAPAAAVPSLVAVEAGDDGSADSSDRTLDDVHSDSPPGASVDVQDDLSADSRSDARVEASGSADGAGATNRRASGRPNSQPSGRTSGRPADKSGAQTSSGGGGSALDAVIATDGALVLEEPDPDSNPIAQLAQGRKVRVSRGRTSGEEKFRKIRVGRRVGYIADIDLQILDDSTAAGASAKERAKKSTIKPTAKEPHPKKTQEMKGRAGRTKSKTADNRKEKSSERRAKRSSERTGEKHQSIYFSRFVGLSVGSSEFKESIDGVNASTNLAFYGLKITGPDVLVDGPVVDFNLLLHFGAPSYYEALSQIRPTGFVLITNAAFLVPWAGGENGLGYLGVGPMLMLSEFTVINGGRKQDLTELNLGLDLDLGLAYRVGRVALRVEAKYFIEKRSYRGIFAALQTQF